MASKNRQQARKHKPVAKGKVLPLHKRKVKADKMNAGGFYEGMPGVVLDQYGNRKMIEFVVTPQGYSTSLLNAPPEFCKKAIQDALSNPMVKNIVHSAVLDQVFSRKTIWNFLLRLRIKLSLHISAKRYKKKAREAQEKMKRELKELERKDAT